MFASTWWWRRSRRCPGHTSSLPATLTGPSLTVLSIKGGQETEITFHINTMTIHRNVAYNISQCEVRPEDQDEVFDAMKSFPSGHAQIACFTATFLIVSLSLSLSLSSQHWRLFSDLPPAPPTDESLSALEVLAPAAPCHHGRHLLHQQSHGQQAPHGRRLGRSGHWHCRGHHWICGDTRRPSQRGCYKSSDGAIY